jgi:hypothetical protein
MKKFLREPLVHFLIIGGGLFLLFGIFNNPAGPQSGRIVITTGQIDFLKANFTRTWKRSPTEKELQGLTESYVRNEIFYREALAMGLDRDDAVIRQRLKQKLEIMSDDLAGLAIPTDEELQQFLETHPKRFSSEPQVAFRHVFFNSDKRGYAAVEEAKALLAELSRPESKRNPDMLPGMTGDNLMLPKSFDLSGASVIARFFGKPFSLDIMKIKPGQWAGPIRSGFGHHLVLVSQKTESRLPELSEIRKTVEQEWSVVNKTELKNNLYKKLKEKYTIVFEPADDKGKSIITVSEARAAKEQEK